MPKPTDDETMGDLAIAQQSKTRPDGPIGTRHIGETGHIDVRMRIYVRSPTGRDLPGQREVENKISDMLLAQPRLDEGVDWDVSATSLLPEGDDETG
jgi:hypothetical protein